jgi:hypothetical protein
MFVFNPPPGWPQMPRDWKPGPAWTPPSSWPPAPSWWSFHVPAILKMSPLDLSKDIRFGLPSEVRPDAVEAVARSAADSIAWRLCDLALHSGVLPLVAYDRYGQEVESALKEAQSRVYSTLIEDTKEWVSRFPSESPERYAAFNLLNFIQFSQSNFLAMARQRIQEVLEATATQTMPRNARSPRGPHQADDRSQQEPDPTPFSGTHHSSGIPQADLLQLARKALNSAWINGGICLFAIFIGIVTVSAAIRYGGHYLIAWGPALWCGIRSFRSLRRYRTLKKLSQTSESRTRQTNSGRRTAGEASPSTWPSAMWSRSPSSAPATGQTSRRSLPEPALGSIIILLGVVGLAIAWYFSGEGFSALQVPGTASSSGNTPILATPRENPDAIAESPQDACTGAVQDSLDYPDSSSEAFTYTRNVHTTKTGVSQWSISGYVEDKEGVLARINFDCTVETTPSGGWSTTYTVTP